jgi:hypothetical protein
MSFMDRARGDSFYEDKTLTCVDCDGEFEFTAGEQRFFASRELSEPKRCPRCRDVRRAQRAAPEDER